MLAGTKFCTCGPICRMSLALVPTKNSHLNWDEIHSYSKQENEIRPLILHAWADTRCLFMLQSSIFCTHAHVAPSEPPQNISGTFINSTSIRVSWTPPPISSHNGMIRHYIIRYSEANDDSSIQTMNTSDLSIEIGGLGKFTEYEVSVSAVTVREGPFNSIVVRTDSDGKWCCCLWLYSWKLWWALNLAKWLSVEHHISNFKLDGLNTYPIGVYTWWVCLILQSLLNPPNFQIKNFAKVFLLYDKGQDWS